VFAIINILFIIFDFDYLIINNLFLIASPNSRITKAQTFLILFLFLVFEKQVTLFPGRRLPWVVRLYIAPAISPLTIRQQLIARGRRYLLREF
jgi:hypothetical protein